MILTRLWIRNLRNLLSLDLAPAAGINLVLGPNGSGKSSLLEAVHLLSCGRSFRTHHLAQLVNREASAMTLGADIATESSGNVTLGMEYERERGRWRMRLSGRPVQKLSEIAAYLPSIIIHQESHRIFTQGPEYRRAFLDWGLFHVEPQFLSTWQRYRRALRQRNSMLQQSGGRPQIWDAELVESGLVIDAQRRRYLQRFEPVFRALMPLLRIETTVTMRYRAGWGEETAFADQLTRSISGDRRAGYTRFGPHRADIDFTVDGVLVKERLSRGQTKVLVYALLLAQACVLAETTGRRGLIMMDDLAAELDSHHIGKLMERINALGFQSLITSSDPAFSEQWGTQVKKRFHVEHGVFKEVV